MRTLGTCETMPLTEVDKLWNGDAEQRADAILYCQTCPVLDVCRDVHADLVSVWGVVAGKDYTKAAATIPIFLKDQAKEPPPTEKVCPSCLLLLPLAMFTTYPSRPNRATYCVDCTRAKNRAYKAASRAKKEAAA